MVSIAVHGGPAPHDALRAAADWGRVVVATLARGLVTTVLGLALWAAAPALIGWQPTTVMTGSMEPRLAPGDVVVSRPVDRDAVRPGQVLLADDPDQPGHLRMHRYVEDGPHGGIVTKGDANPQADSTPLRPSAVHGVAVLRIPFVGTPITWVRDGAWPRVGLLAVAVAAVLALCAVDGPLRRTGSERDGDDDGERGRSGRHARGGPDPSLPSVVATAGRSAAASVSRRRLRRRARRVRRLRRLGGAAAVLLLAGSAVSLLPVDAVAAPFAQTTTNPTSTFGALTVPQATALSCAPNADGTVRIAFDYGGPAATSFSVLNGTTVLATGSSSPVRVVGTGLLSLAQTYTVTVRVNLVGNFTSTSTATAKIQTAVAGTSLSCG